MGSWVHVLQMIPNSHSFLGISSCTVTLPLAIDALHCTLSTAPSTTTQSRPYSTTLCTQPHTPLLYISSPLHRYLSAARALYTTFCQQPPPLFLSAAPSSTAFCQQPPPPLLSISSPLLHCFLSPAPSSTAFCQQPPPPLLSVSSPLLHCFLSAAPSSTAFCQQPPPPLLSISSPLLHCFLSAAPSSTASCKHSFLSSYIF